MKSGVPWQVKGVRRQARETAREAARRSGMSVGEWLDSVILDRALDEGIEPRSLAPNRYDDRSDEPDGDSGDLGPRNFARAHGDDDERTDRDEGIRRRYPRYGYRPRPRADRARPADDEGADYPAGPEWHLRTDDADRPIVDQGFAAVDHRRDGLHRQLGPSAELNAADSQISQRDRRDAEPPLELVELMSKLDGRLDQLIAEGRSAKAEIEQRVDAVDRAVADLNRDRPSVSIDADSLTPLDQALIEIADRQRTLDGYAPLPAGSASRNPAMPAEPAPPACAQELSGLEQQLRQINTRIETLRQPCGLDKAVDALRADLAEIGVMLQEAMPRKAVEALESEVRNLAERIDHTRHTGADEPALAGVERGLAEVRDALQGLTPAENLVGVDQAVQQLARKIDIIADNAQDPAALYQLERAITAMRGIAAHVASNDALARLSDEVRALGDKVDRAAGSGTSGILSVLEDRIAALADALEARNQRGQSVPQEIDVVVKGLTDKIERVQLTRGDLAAFRHLEDRIATLVEKLDASDARLNHLEAIERGLTEMLIHFEHQRMPSLARTSQPELDALSRDLADLWLTEKKTQDTLEVVHGTLGHVVDRLAMIETDLRGKPAINPAPRSDAVPAAAPSPPNLQPSSLEPPGVDSPSLDSTSLDSTRLGSTNLDSTSLDPTRLDPPNRDQPSRDRPSRCPASPDGALPAGTVAPAATERRPIDPYLPPGHSWEPGFGGPRGRNPPTPTGRIAASRLALVRANAPVFPDPGDKANFIAAARRAAQASGRDAPPKSERSTSSDTTSAGKLASRVGTLRVLVGGGAAALLVIGSLQIARTLRSSHQAEIAPPGATAPAAPRMTTAAPADEREITGTVSPTTKPADVPAPVPTPAPAPSLQAPAAPAPPSDRLPAAFGSSLRTAAANGDPAAEYEVAVRYAEGRGVQQNLGEAAEWFERAARHGLAPAQFRLGGLYEKGLGVKKGLDTARRLYLAAGEAGNAKALHNLAVLYAEGIDGKPDYQAAARWFRKAADYGVTDSQFNLAVLYMGGIGVEQNLAEAYRWFTLAAREGDTESAKKRDEVGARLDQQALKAAAQAVEGWTPEPQPEMAVQVKVPSGGWSDGGGTSAAAPVKRKPPTAEPDLAIPRPGQ
jgi:localization factor PodJL